jgi:hypothetical protein
MSLPRRAAQGRNSPAYQNNLTANFWTSRPHPNNARTHSKKQSARALRPVRSDAIRMGCEKAIPCCYPCCYPYTRKRPD